MFGKCERCKDEKNETHEVTCLRVIPARLCLPCRRDLDLFVINSDVAISTSILEMKLETAAHSKDYDQIEFFYLSLTDARKKLIPEIMTWLSRVPLQRAQEPISTST